jgi:ATP-binding cassette subfamily F protein 3
VILSVANVSKSFDADTILSGVTFRMEAREKVALVGRNGAGKTTLLRILTGQYEPTSGAVQLARGAKIGYLRQEMPVSEGRTVIEEAESSREAQLQMKARLAELEERLENGPTDAELEEYALLHEHFLDAEGYSAERDLRTVLLRMGFTEEEFDKPTSALSGGEKTRLALARMLLEEPDLLILDEPTNHLDLQATEWLEGWLRQYHGAVLLVSHDRAFLENTADRVLEMREGTVKSYPGPFGKYLQLRAEEDARLAEVAKRQEAEIAKMDEYVRRFMNSQRTAQARGRLKLMNRLIESKVQAPKNDRQMKGGFGDAKRSGDLVLTAEKLTVGFPDETLFRGLNWTVRNGERWGVIGENGAGKSTLLRVCMGEMEPLSGRARLGANVVAGYFTQDARDLDLDMSPIDTMVYELDLKPAEARDLLARFLITGDDVYRPIKTMSGGEKNKLSLAKLTHLNPNLLVLDEPTNHLDMASREALADVLKDFKGTLVLISHDRWLLGQVTDHTLDVKRSGPVQYPGGYEDYRRKREIKPAMKGKDVPPGPTIPKLLDGKSAPEEPTLTPRELSKEIARMEKVVAETEQRVTDEEEALKELEDRLANLPPAADVYALTREHQALQERLEGSMAAWEENSARLERLVAQRG